MNDDEDVIPRDGNTSYDNIDKLKNYGDDRKEKDESGVLLSLTIWFV